MKNATHPKVDPAANANGVGSLLQLDAKTGDVKPVGGLTVRAYVATHIAVPTSILTDLLSCDDKLLLERFGTEEEKEQGFTPVDNGGYRREAGRMERGQGIPLRNLELRHQLESRARAWFRAIEADALIAELNGEAQADE